MRSKVKLPLNHFVLCLLLISINNFASAITLQELREIVSFDYETVTRGIIVSEIDILDNNYVSSSTPEGKEDEASKIKRINSRQKYRSTYTFDMKRCLSKEVREDLRDLDKIAQAEKLNPVQKCNVNCSQSVVVDNLTLNEISFLDSARTGAEPQACLNKLPGKRKYQIEPGTINYKYIKGNYHTKLTPLNDNDSDLLKVEISFDENGDSRLEYICDPGLGYRFREQNWISKGQVVKKITADDYRIINGLPYPFVYTTTYFRDGEVIKKITKKIENAKLNPELTENDFKIFFPKGTFIIEDIILHSTRTIENGGEMGVSDVLGIYAEEVAAEELSSLTESNFIGQNKSTKTILPKMQIAQTTGQPFILDLASNTMFAVNLEEDVKGESAYHHFLEYQKGDILWDGRVVAIRDAKLISTNPDEIKIQHKEWVSICEVSLGSNFIVKTKEDEIFQIYISEVNEDRMVLSISNMSGDIQFQVLTLQ